MFDQNLGYYLELGLMFVISLSFHELATPGAGLGLRRPDGQDDGPRDAQSAGPPGHLGRGRVHDDRRFGMGQARAGQPGQPPSPAAGRLHGQPGRPDGQFPLAEIGASRTIAWHFPAAMIEHKFLTHFLAHFIWWNLGLMIFNLIPLYPLDGHAHAARPFARAFRGLTCGGKRRSACTR